LGKNFRKPEGGGVWLTLYMVRFPYKSNPTGFQPLV